MTEPEVWLWARLKRLHARGYHFRRQRPFHGYYLDFVCIDRRLAVEVDGGQHADKAADGKRDADLAALGYRVIRVWNNEVLGNIDGVYQMLLTELRK